MRADQVSADAAIGRARAALDQAKANGNDPVIGQRNVDEALAPILHGLRWVGLQWDEGPEVGGPYGAILLVWSPPEKPLRHWIKIKNSKYSQLQGRQELFERRPGADRGAFVARTERGTA